MKKVNSKLSNYIGQEKNSDLFTQHLLLIDKDLYNLRTDVNTLIGYVRGDSYDDVNIASTILGKSASAPGNVTISSTTIEVLGFDGNVTTEQVYGCIEIPHSYKEGTNITPHLNWMPTTASASNVKWQLEYNISSESSSITATSTTITVSSSTPGVAWQEIRADFPIITGTNLTIGKQVSFRLFRNPADGADTYPDDAALLTIGFHYQQNSLGSTSITTK
jgi:hypothetical protein